MATVKFSVPDAINSRFNKTFKGRNKSALLSQLMEEAITQEESHKRRAKAVDAILALRASARPASASEVRKARRLGRP